MTFFNKNGNTDYCKNKCSNYILPKNNVNSPSFSNTSKNIRNSQRISSQSPRFLTGITIFGNIETKPQINGILNDNVKKYYVLQSLKMSMKIKR
jgi:hypothetical protein